MLKKLIIFLVLTAFWNCQNRDSPNIEFAQGVTGKYQITSFKRGSQFISMPSNGISGEFTSNRFDATNISLSYMIKDQFGTGTIDLAIFELKPTSKNAIYSLNLDIGTYGTISANEIMFKDTAADGTDIEIRAVRN
jgi:hypothetical protein